MNVNQLFRNQVTIRIDLYTVFSTFDMDKLGKILRHHWKEPPNTLVNKKIQI